MLTKIFNRSKITASSGTKRWKQYEKKGMEAEARNALMDAKTFYKNALDEIQKIAENDTRHERYFAFKISQMRFALDRVLMKMHDKA